MGNYKKYTSAPKYQILYETGLKQWQVAEKCGVVESTFIRWLRFNIPEERRKAIFAAIEALKAKEA